MFFGTAFMARAAHSTPVGPSQRLIGRDCFSTEPSLEQPRLRPVPAEEQLANSWQADRYARIPPPQAAINTSATTRLANALRQWPPVAQPTPVTTLVVKHIDRGLCQEHVLQQFPRTAFYKYDLLYLVFDRKRNSGSGRIIINFETPAAASAFRRAWHGRAHAVLSALDQETGGKRRLAIEDAHVQGFRANIKHYQTKLSPEPGAAFAPVIFDEGRRCEFWGYMVDPVSASEVISL